MDKIDWFILPKTRIETTTSEISLEEKNNELSLFFYCKFGTEVKNEADDS